MAFGSQSLLLMSTPSTTDQPAKQSDPPYSKTPISGKNDFTIFELTKYHRDIRNKALLLSNEWTKF